MSNRHKMLYTYVYMNFHSLLCFCHGHGKSICGVHQDVDQPDHRIVMDHPGTLLQYWPPHSSIVLPSFHKKYRLQDQVSRERKQHIVPTKACSQIVFTTLSYPVSTRSSGSSQPRSSILFLCFTNSASILFL